MEREEQKKASLISPLITGSRENGVGEGFKREELVGEVKKQLWLAGPLVCVSLLQFFLQMISVMFVGHLGELPLSGASMATSFATVTGFSLLMGLANALDTFCGQSFGAKQYHVLGVHLQRAVVVLVLVSIPLSVIWANTESILVLVGQDPDISHEAGVYARFMIPSLFAYGILQCLNRFLQTQNIVFPMMFCSGLTTLVHLPVCWAMVYKFSLGIKGAALANCFSYWVNVLLLAAYVKFSPTCSRTWTGFSKDGLQNLPKFLRLAIPSATMTCLEMWSFELIVLLSGLLPHPQLQTSVLSICLNTSATIWMVPFGLAAAVSTRVSNELGAGHPQAAKMAVRVALLMAVTQGALFSALLVIIRNVWGYAYSNEVEVVDYVATMAPIVATSNFIDGLQTVLSGTARGCGWQKIGAVINLGSYYIVGIPSAVLLAFVLHVGGKGLWLGILSGLFVQGVSLFIITIRTNWDEQAKEATCRVYDSTMPNVDTVS